jgi:two-component system, cell cycle sensor histidine kinase and response regulator CckA
MAAVAFAGLGLAMVYGIVRQSDGFISTHSQVGVGTTFKIYLAAAVTPVHEIAVQSPTEPPVHGGSETLLVVEDEDAVRQSQLEFLSTIGYTVLSAANRKEALDSVKGRPDAIDLVITDVVMPKMSGPRMAENLPRSALI